MRLLNLVILLMFSAANILAVQFYPENVRVVSFDTKQGATYFGQSHTSTQVHFLYITTNNRTSTLTCTIGKKVNSFTLTTDNIVSVGNFNHQWIIGFVRDREFIVSIFNDSLLQFTDTVLQRENGDQVKVLFNDGRYCVYSYQHQLSRFEQTSSNVVKIVREDRNEFENCVKAYTDGNSFHIINSLSQNTFELSTIINDNVKIIGLVKATNSCIIKSPDGYYYLYNENGKYVLKYLNEEGSIRNVHTQYFGYYEPLCLYTELDTVIVIFRNGIVRSFNDNILTSNSIDFSILKDDVRCSISKSEIYLSDGNTNVVLNVEIDSFWQLRQFIETVKYYFTSIIILILILFLLYKLVTYRSIIRSVIENTNDTVSFVLDRNMKLRRINSKGRELFKMDSSTPLRRVLRFYCNHEYQKVIESFVLNAYTIRNSIQQKLVLNENYQEREMVFTAQPIQSLTGAFTGVVINATDITEELEKKRLVNWAQLAHDMQTNLSIIKLNAEQLPLLEIDKLNEKKHRIIFQAGLLLQRVRDIISIGRDERLHTSETDVHAMFNEIIREFEDDQFNNVTFVTLSNPFYISIDKTKMFRAVRNAVENGIRALKGEVGTITLKCTKQNKNVVISIQDTGVGMDVVTRDNFLKPYFSNYRQYGGTGIGTMIMLRAVEIHNGNIVVHSEVGKGTTIEFELPEKQSGNSRNKK